MEQQSNIKKAKTAKGFFQQVLSCYQNHKDQQLSTLFHELYNDQGYLSLSSQKWKNTPNTNVYITKDQMGQYFAKLLDLIKQYLIQKSQHGIKTAFPIHLKVVIAALKCYQQIKQEDDQWIQKPLRKIVRVTKKIFFLVYKICLHQGSGNKIKTDLLNTLQRFKGARTLSNQTKSMILPLIDNMQVSIFGVFHNYQQIQRILNAPRTYNFYPDNIHANNHFFQKAKFSLINEWIKQADQNFSKIKLKTKGQKRLVLKYWIPCKIFLGQMFQAKNQRNQQRFPEYEKLIESIKKANFLQYDEVVERYQKIWIKRGLYLLMDKFRLIIWRNLIKRVYLILGQKIDFEQIQKAVHLAGGQQSLNECICIVSNLIAQGYIKGYIFQTEAKRTLVLKKNNAAFPKLKALFN